MSDSLWPHGLYSPWNSLGQNTGVGSLPVEGWGRSIPQRIFSTQELNWGLLHCRQILYQLSYQGSPSIKSSMMQMKGRRGGGAISLWMLSYQNSALVLISWPPPRSISIAHILWKRSTIHIEIYHSFLLPSPLHCKPHFEDKVLSSQIMGPSSILLIQRGLILKHLEDSEHRDKNGEDGVLLLIEARKKTLQENGEASCSLAMVQK